LSDKVDENVRRREVRYDRERRVRIKWSEDTESLEEVFDRRTIMTVLKMLNTGILKELHGAMKSGKESKIYHGIDPKGEEVAVKIFLTTSNIFRHGRLKYIRGDPRFKDIPHDTTSLVDQWASKEYKNLELADHAGISVPKPIHVEKNVLILGFIGKDGIPAPVLREVRLQAAADWYKKIIELIKQMYDKAKLVHGDLSEYNIMIPNGYPVIIDFGQAVTTEHPEARAFLERDIGNINHYFEGLNVRTQSPAAVIPKDRVGVLVGSGGTVKSTIEDKLFVDLKIDSPSGAVEIGVKPDAPDPSGALQAKDIVLAIGRGFSPERAFRLFSEDNTLDIIDLHDFFGKNEAEIRRVDGRIIGREGKTRRILEELTGTAISVSGHTVSIIGGYEAVTMAKDALEKLIKGRQHGTVYKFLRRRRQEIKKEKALGLWEGQVPTAKKP